VTKGIRSIRSAASSSASRMPGSSTVVPGGARSTIVAELSAASGKVMRSWSSATCEEAPGMENSSLKVPPKASASTPRRASSAAHAAITRPRAR